MFKLKNKYRGWRFGLGVVPCEFSAADDHDGVSAVAAADADQCDSRLLFFIDVSSWLICRFLLEFCSLGWCTQKIPI